MPQENRDVERDESMKPQSGSTQPDKQKSAEDWDQMQQGQGKSGQQGAKKTDEPGEQSATHAGREQRRGSAEKE